MKLKVLSDYTCRDLSYPAGVIIEVTAADAAFLLNDAPGCFEIVKAVEQPAENKAVQSPPANKAVRVRRRSKNDEND